MILTGSEDIRVKKTIISIRNAFCEMICEMDYERITVKELCERAMINKKPFTPIMQPWMICSARCKSPILPHLLQKSVLINYLMILKG